MLHIDLNYSETRIYENYQQIVLSLLIIKKFNTLINIALCRIVLGQINLTEAGTDI